MTFEESIKEYQLKANTLKKKVEKIINENDLEDVIFKKVIAAQDKRIEELKFKLLQLEEEVDEYETEN